MPILSFAQRLHGNRMIAMFVTFLLMGGMGYVISKCSEQPGSREVRVGQRIMYQIMGSETLHKTEFFDRYPDAAPSDFVAFLESPAGERLWPPAEGEGEEKVVDVPGRSSSNRIRRPPSLTFSAREPTPGESPQIVYVPDDANQKMVIEGYDPGNEEPVFEYDWKFPTDAGAIPLD